MDITKLAKEPSLVEITLDSEAIVNKYGEAISFWTLDRQPLEIYFKLVGNVDDEGNIKDFSQMVLLMKDFILDNKGKPVFDGKKTVPMDITVDAVNKIAGMLGN